MAREYWLSEVVQMPESFGLGAAKSSNRQVPVINLFVFSFCRFLLPFSGDDSGAGKRQLFRFGRILNLGERERELDDYTPLDGEGEFDRTGGARRLEWGF